MSIISDIQDHIEELKKSTDSTMAIKLEEKINKALDFQLDLKLSALTFEEKAQFDNNTSWGLHLYIGSITVLDRMTGFSFGRDIESGFRDPYNKFWLASGNFDIREQGDITVREAISLIKANANTCGHNKERIVSEVDPKINKCDDCVNCFATCENKNVEFGDGFGNDNVIACDSFTPCGFELGASEWTKELKI